MKKSLLVTLLFLCCLTKGYCETEHILYKDSGNRFTIGYTTNNWDNWNEVEVVRFFIINHTASPLEFKVKANIIWTCDRTTDMYIGRGANTLTVKPSEKLFGWEVSRMTLDSQRQSCVLRSGEKLTTIKDLSITIESVKTTSGTNLVTDSGTSDSGGASGKCNKGLPQVMLSLEGDYFWKLKDGSYKHISKEQYDFLKNLPSDEEKTKWVQNCTPYPLIKLKAKPMTD